MTNELLAWRSWDLKGLRVTQLRFDAQLHIHMWTLDRDLLVSFGNEFIFKDADGRTSTFDPERVSELAPILGLLFKPVLQSSASSTGICILKFEDGSELQCEPHEKYEAWESRGTENLQGASLLCGPGGGSPWGK